MDHHSPQYMFRFPVPQKTVKKDMGRTSMSLTLITSTIMVSLIFTNTIHIIRNIHRSRENTNFLPDTKFESPS